jgi:thiol-disulfide isomerase/thioredoxin
MKNTSLILFILIAGLILTSCSSNKKPDTSIANIEKLTANKDIVIINYWSIFCLPCMEEMPMIASLYNEYKNAPNISISTIALNSKSELDQFFSGDTVNIYAKVYSRMNTKMEFPVLAYYKYDSKLNPKNLVVVPNQKNDTALANLTSKFKIEGLPTTIVYFKGKEFKRFVGFGGDGTELRKDIADVIVGLDGKL